MDAIDFAITNIIEERDDWRDLREIGYRNPLNFELKFKQLPVEILPEAVSLTRSIGEYMLKNIVGE